MENVSLRCGMEEYYIHPLKIETIYNMGRPLKFKTL